MPTPPAEPEFPFKLVWLETGEVATFEDADDLLCNLEDFDSDDPSDNAEAAISDCHGRSVSVRVKIWENLCEFSLA